MIKTVTYCLALAAAALPLACSASSSGEDVGKGSAAVTYGGLNLTWQNTTTGAVSNWTLSGATVTGQQALSWSCGASGNCASTWSAVDTQSNSILWFDQTSGQLQSWYFDENDVVTTTPMLSWTCSAASGCASAWRPIGSVSLDMTCVPETFCGQQEGVLWHNASTGVLSVWDLSSSTGTTVTGTQTLSWSCGPSNGCSQAWRADLTADMNNDGNTDVVWYNETTGVVSTWLLDGATVTGTQNLSWQCTVASGCAAAWKIIGAADVNGDGHTDLAWYDATSGQVSIWLLDGKGNVTGTSTLSWTCSTASGCAPAWKPLGFTSYPEAPPR